MELKIHNPEVNPIAELQSECVEIESTQDALDLMGDSGYLGAGKIIIMQHHLCPDFFDLKSGVAGEILQKFSNYNVQLAVVGDFSVYKSKSLKDFIYESNKTGRIIFVATLDEAVRKL